MSATTNTCRTCNRPLAHPHVRRCERTGEITEVCVGFEHDGLVASADVAFERDARVARFERKGDRRGKPSEVASS